MTTKNHIDLINDLEERIETLERNHKGFASNVVVLLSFLHPEIPELSKLGKKHLAKLNLLFQDRDFDFEDEKVILNFLKEMKHYL